jgi:hypothetical protein
MDPALGMADRLFDYVRDPANVGALVAAVGSGAFAVFSFVSERRAHRRNKETEDRLELLQQEGLRASLDAQVIAWGSAAIEALAEAERIAATRRRYATPFDLEVARDTTITRLSAQVDQGRLFFPNVSHDLVGLDRPFANRGFRQPILDALMLALEWLRRVEHDAPETVAQAQAAALFAARRAFVSELQRALDPRRRLVIFENLSSSRVLERRGDDVVWDAVQHLVDAFEETHGPGSFWKDRPKPRKDLVPPK